MLRSRCLRFAAVVSVLGVALALGSCATSESDSGDGGYLGSSLTLSGPLYYLDKGGPTVSPADGTLEFAMGGGAVIGTAAVTDGAFTVTFAAPDAADTAVWSSILPIAATISAPAAKGYVITDVLFDRTDPVAVDIPVMNINYALTSFVFLLYTDTDVTITGTGTYDSPVNAPGPMRSMRCRLAPERRRPHARIFH